MQRREWKEGRLRASNASGAAASLQSKRESTLRMVRATVGVMPSHALALGVIEARDLPSARGGHADANSSAQERRAGA